MPPAPITPIRIVRSIGIVPPPLTVSRTMRRAMTVGRAIWPDQLSGADRTALAPGHSGDVVRRADVVVVGGGIIGLATAAAVHAAGLGSVLVLERAHLGAGASGGAAGQLLPEAHVGLDPPVLIALARRGLAGWRALADVADVGLEDLAWLGLERGARQFAVEPAAGGELLDAAEVATLVPGLRAPTTGVLVRDQARVNPLRALAALARRGPRVLTGVQVDQVLTRGDRVQAVETSIGRIETDAVVLATGTVPRLPGLEMLADVPSGEVKGHMLVTRPTTLRLPGTVAPLATTIEDGRLMVGGTLDLGDDERVVRPAVIDGMWREVVDAWPAAAGIEIEYTWACFRPAHPDHLPTIDRVPTLANAWLASGHYKTGILLAPATGQLLAEWIASGRQPPAVGGLGVARFGHPAPDGQP
jgi:glycine oxidase